MCDLGRWALAEATAQLVRWDAEGGHRGGLDVAVNISGRHLAQAHLLDDVTDALTASGIHPNRLTVEITETVLVDEPLALEHLRSLRELGVRVAIDDFGTGYTSIGQLSRLPVDVLKIDRSFVSSPEAGNADLVRLLISAAHSFSLGVVAEGVEEDGQLSALLAASCDAAQGYLFARPVPPPSSRRRSCRRRRASSPSPGRDTLWVTPCDQQVTPRLRGALVTLPSARTRRPSRRVAALLRDEQDVAAQPHRARPRPRLGLVGSWPTPSTSRPAARRRRRPPPTTSPRPSRWTPCARPSPARSCPCWARPSWTTRARPPPSASTSAP